MKRKLLGLILISALVLSTSGCMISIGGSNNNSNKALGHTLDYIYNEDYDALALDKAHQMINLLDEENKLDQIMDLYLDFKAYMEELATYSNIEYIKTSIKQNDESNEKYIYFQNKLTELFNLEDEFRLKASKSSYKKDFFPNMSDEEIELELNDTKPAEFEVLNGEIEKLLLELRKLKGDKLIKEAPEYYSKIVTNYNKMAKLAGYDNYLDYAYKEVYSRDYTPNDINDFTSYVKKYVVPEMKEASTKVDGLKNSMSKKNYNKFVSLATTSYLDESFYLDEYAKYVGGSFYLNYQSLFDNGYYYFSNDKDAIDGAYTTYLYSLDTPAVYFGPGYSGIMTVCHEYGHYFAYKQNNGGAGSFDLAETQSQGNELVFISYLEQESTLLDPVSEAFKEYQVLDYLKNIIMATMVNEFEIRVYRDNITDPAKYDEIFISVANEYGGYEELKKLYGFEITDYWKMVCLDNAGYYISYAVSLVPSLELYSFASENLRNAINMLIELSTYITNDDSYIVTLENAGLTNPFTEEAFKSIPSLIN